MNKFRHGFIVGAVLLICVSQMPFIGPGLVRHFGPCYNPSDAQIRKLIMDSATRPGNFSYGELEPYDDVELTKEDGNYIVYATRLGKRVTRHLPMVSCGYLEWAYDQTFAPER